MTGHQLLETAVTVGPGGPEIVVSGELDMSTAPQLWECLTEFLAAGPTVIVFDLHDLRFMDSSGLTTIVRAVKALRARGGDLIVRSPSLSVHRLLQISAVDRLVTIEAPPVESRPQADDDEGHRM